MVNDVDELMKRIDPDYQHKCIDCGKLVHITIVKNFDLDTDFKHYRVENQKIDLSYKTCLCLVCYKKEEERESNFEKKINEVRKELETKDFSKIQV